jgi:energy-coupling factor transport system permease protein
LLPEIRILIYIVFVASLFFIESHIIYAAFLVVILILLLKSPFKSIFSGWIPISILLGFTFLGNLLFHHGKVIYQAGPLLITEEGMDIAFLRTIRLFFMIAGAKVLTAATGLDRLVLALGNIFSPLERFGVSSGEFFATMGLTLKSLPKLKARIGEAYREEVQNRDMKGFWPRAKALSAFLVPLFVRTIQSPESFFREDNGKGRDSSG